MKTSLFFLFISLRGISQNEITFEVEKLSKPEDFLYQESSKKIYEDLIASDINFPSHRRDISDITLPYNIIAQSASPDSLVNFGYQSFFNGMYEAYADHRPFVISPDMIWLLISQGFARHINNNSEILRSKFASFRGKSSLIVTSETIDLNSPSKSWEEIFPNFQKQISEHTGRELIDVLTANFTTTTPTTKLASEITTMKAMDPYFEFIVIRIACGIPEITLQGTSEDWQKVYSKTKALSKYDLEWWTKELEPILLQFIETSKGNVKKKFWRNMFKYHSQKEYGAPKIVDGWIIKFFPYDKNGKRHNLEKLEGSKSLPEEIIKVDLKYIDTNQNTIMLELWAGFIGLEQNKLNYALTPQIGWMIRKKDVNEIALINKLNYDNNSNWGKISIRVKEFPTALFALKHIKDLEIVFIDEIQIPDKFAEIKVDKLKLRGKITTENIQRLKTLFPNTKIVVNKEPIN